MKKLSEETIKSVLDGFNFNKMVAAMETIGWPNGRLVTVAELKARAEDRLRSLSFDPDGDGYCTASYGGFLEARLSFDEGWPVSVELRFIGLQSEEWNVDMTEVEEGP